MVTTRAAATELAGAVKLGDELDLERCLKRAEPTAELLCRAIEDEWYIGAKLLLDALPDAQLAAVAAWRSKGAGAPNALMLACKQSFGPVSVKLIRRLKELEPRALSRMMREDDDGQAMWDFALRGGDSTTLEALLDAARTLWAAITLRGAVKADV